MVNAAVLLLVEVIAIGAVMLEDRSALLSPGRAVLGWALLLEGWAVLVLGPAVVRTSVL